MYVVMGATGHVGGAVAASLLAAGKAVTALVHDRDSGDALRAAGATVVAVDVRDTAALRAAFRAGRRAFLLNPPAPVATDTDREERASVRGIVDALSGSGLEKVVAASTYGAQPGERIGDLSVLYDLEMALAAQPIPATIQRGAYYMSNWDPLLDAARHGRLPTMFPADLAIPMVAPADLGRIAARHLRRHGADDVLYYAEGPDRYTPNDVARAFADALGTPVAVAVTPREKWRETYQALGFSDAAADSYARMTAVSIDGELERPAAPERGETTLSAYVAALVARAGAA